MLESILKLFFSAISFVLFGLNNLLFPPLFIPVLFIKFLSLFSFLSKFLDSLCIYLGQLWISINNFNMLITKNIKWDIQGEVSLSRNAWYLLVSNHQSAVDIVVLQKFFFEKDTFSKVFSQARVTLCPFLRYLLVCFKISFC